MFEFKFKDQKLVLLPEKAIYWEDRRALLLADTHFGKVTHFRKSGISIPDGAAIQNLFGLQGLLDKMKPESVYFLGDLFHSEMNSEWIYFKELIQKYPAVQFKLIQGNHDIFHEMTYQKGQFEFFDTPLTLGPFILSHEPMEDFQSGYNLCGHIHPGVKLFGQARQALRFPCFSFSKNQGILPAFGEFTGLHLLKPKKSDQIFVIAQNQIIQAN